MSNCVETLCPEVTMMNGTSRDTDARRYNVSVTYTCQTGSTFPDGTAVRELHCGEGGRWHGVVEGCQGKPRILQIFSPHTCHNRNLKPALLML